MCAISESRDFCAASLEMDVRPEAPTSPRRTNGGRGSLEEDEEEDVGDEEEERRDKAVWGISVMRPSP